MSIGESKSEQQPYSDKENPTNFAMSCNHEAKLESK